MLIPETTKKTRKGKENSGMVIPKTKVKHERVTIIGVDSSGMITDLPTRKSNEKIKSMISYDYHKKKSEDNVSLPTISMSGRREKYLDIVSHVKKPSETKEERLDSLKKKSNLSTEEVIEIRKLKEDGGEKITIRKSGDKIK